MPPPTSAAVTAATSTVRVGRVLVVDDVADSGSKTAPNGEYGSSPVLAYGELPGAG